MRWEGRVVAVGGEVESRQIARGLRVVILHGIQGNIWIVIGILALYMLRGKLSFLCGRRRERELPLQLCGGLWEQSSEKRLEVSLSLVAARLQELPGCRWIRTKEGKMATSRLNWELIVSLRVRIWWLMLLWLGRYLFAVVWCPLARCCVKSAAWPSTDSTM